MKQMKRMVLLLLTVVFAVSLPLSAFAAGTIEVTEDVSVSDDYDWTRFKGQNVTLNVYNWGEYISNGSDDSADVVDAFQQPHHHRDRNTCRQSTDTPPYRRAYMRL